MLEPERLATIRKQLHLSQEQMGRLLGVSFASVNRWEGGHSGPSGPTLDLYHAIGTALQLGHSPHKIKLAANNERGTFLRTLFNMAYSQPRSTK